MSSKSESKREATFIKDGSSYSMRLKRTGTTLPQPARIQVFKWYWEHVGGVRGWETTCIYDRTFKNWDYAHAVFDEILKRSDKDGRFTTDDDLHM